MRLALLLVLAAVQGARALPPSPRGVRNVVRGSSGFAPPSSPRCDPLSVRGGGGEAVSEAQRRAVARRKSKAADETRKWLRRERRTTWTIGLVIFFALSPVP